MLHYRNLQFYLRLGLKLKKVHHILEFNQSQWLKLYDEFNTRKGIEPEKDDDEDRKVLYKLTNDAVYGKKWKTCGIELVQDS